MTPTIRTLTAADVGAAWRALELAFGGAPQPADDEVEHAVVDPARFYAAYDGDAPVATAGSFAFDLAVPLTVDRGAAFRRPVPPGRPRLVDPSSPELPHVYEQVAAVTPGWPARDKHWWRMRLHDPEHARSGAAPLQAVVAGGADGVEGYALYATDGTWQDSRPAGTVRVRELVAATAGAHAQLWRHLLDLDLTATTTARLAAPDEPLLHLLDVAALGAAYLGGTPLSSLVAAGAVEERTAGAAAALSTALGPLGRALWCPQVF